MASLHDICEQVLTSADFIMDIPGFGHEQIQPAWPAQNGSHPLQKKICQTFGWTSGLYGVELVEGYRMAEDLIVYMVLNDDSFQKTDQSPGLVNSFYGGSIYPSIVRKGSLVRGNIVIFKLMIKNKRWKQQQHSPLSDFLFQFGDDSDLQDEYELYPMSKLEVGLMLQERRKALDQGRYTRRMW
eukprot:CAMPEP_0178749172 /NCGR_PEP_ID=MMETSP0744-20121128/9268_1 /TAXON_ID=913974 /ORGANISM="Nitzschia punctata, Strain CCMP561" /LENGTH=183 /DNA_ID=CAMNT_0020402567 /DNA_START=423 /DNA_END=971 /DNA_ORIENTATION=+